MRVSAALLAILLIGCGPEPQRSNSWLVAQPTERYFAAVQARSHEVYPQAEIRGRFRVVDGCGLLDEALLIFPHGTKFVPGGGDIVLFGGRPDKRLRPGMTIWGGGGHYPLAQFGGGSGGRSLAAEIPERCRRLTDDAVVVAPGATLLPPSRFAEQLYAAVHRDWRGPGPLAPVGGILLVEDQCLLLDDKLLILPAASSVGFDQNGVPEIRIASDRYRESVPARPGDRISGGGGGITAEAETISAMPLPLIEPIPERCRPPGRGGVLLNPGPEVRRAAASPYRDPGAGGTFAVPPPSPPRPISDPADCPPGAKLSFGMCRDARGDAVRPKAE